MDWPLTDTDHPGITELTLLVTVVPLTAATGDSCKETEPTAEVSVFPVTVVPVKTEPTAEVIKFVLMVGRAVPETLTLFTVVLILVPVAINLLIPIVAPKLTVIPKLFAGKWIVPSADTIGEFKETVVLKLFSWGIICGVTDPCASDKLKPFTKWVFCTV